MIKILLLIFVLLFTGCTSNFNIEIKDESIIQNVSISMNNNELTKNSVAKTLEDIVMNVYNDTEFLGYFSIVGSNKSNPLKAVNTYNLNSYDFDYALYYCYDNQNISYSNNNLKIETSNYFNCFDKYNMLDEVNINVTTGYKVLETNADKIDGNTYTWNITKSNKKGIKLVLDTTVDEIEEKEIKKEQINKNLIFIIIGILVLLGFSTIIYVYIKSNKNNKI